MKLELDYGDIAEHFPGAVRFDIAMDQLTRWRIGGKADVIIEPSSVEETSQVIRYLNDRNIPWIVLGHTTNVLVSDEGIRGAIVLISDRMANISIDETVVWGQAGIWMPKFSMQLGRQGLTGLEHTIGIPGTLGGLICMNGGSQRKSIGDHITQVTCLDRTGEVFQLARDECGFAYRKSTMQGEGWIVLEAYFQMEKGDPKKIRREMCEILASRRKKFPQKLPNCGSVFVSDPAMYKDYGPPGAVIEQCGLKGYQIGGAQISPLHANFFVNTGRASASDMLSLIHLARGKVSELTGCELNCEVRFIHPDCKIEPAHRVNLP